MRLAGVITTVIALLPTVLACNGYTGGVPAAVGTKTNSKVIEVAAGQTFDGKWYRYDRGSGACTGQTEGGSADAVFLLKEGATLRNVIIGKNQVGLLLAMISRKELTDSFQAEGVHCQGHCRLEFVWFEDVCEDAISIKQDKPGKESWIVGGGAYHASDKVVQHNGCGTVNIINFYVNDYGKLYRSCGNVSSSGHQENSNRIVTYQLKSAPHSASAMSTSRVSLPSKGMSWLVSTATTGTPLLLKTSALTQKLSARCTLAVLVAASQRRPVFAPAKLV